MKDLKIELLSVSPITNLHHAMSKPYNTDFVNMEPALAIKKLKAITIGKKHDSVLEHIVFTFNIEGISRLCLQELARHRIASYTVQSTRFTLPDKTGARHLLEKIESLEEWNDAEGISELIDSYFVNPYLASPRGEPYYKFMLSSMKLFLEKIEKGGSSDYVKYYLPEGWRVNLTWTINLRALRNFLYLRVSKQAHPEIRNLAQSIIRMFVHSEYGEFISDIYRDVTYNKDDNKVNLDTLTNEEIEKREFSKDDKWQSDKQ